MEDAFVSVFLFTDSIKILVHLDVFNVFNCLLFLLLDRGSNFLYNYVQKCTSYVFAITSATVRQLVVFIVYAMSVF